VSHGNGNAGNDNSESRTAEWETPQHGPKNERETTPVFRHAAPKGGGQGQPEAQGKQFSSATDESP